MTKTEVAVVESAACVPTNVAKRNAFRNALLNGFVAIAKEGTEPMPKRQCLVSVSMITFVPMHILEFLLSAMHRF